jgi:exopolysaccharide biosynthesis polyprenyl glycosylphosphotransferase
MLKHEAAARAGGLALVDLASLAAALPLAYVAYARLLGPRWAPPLHELWPELLAAGLAWLAAAALHRLYQPSPGGGRLRELTRALRTLASVAVLLSALAFLAKRQDLPRALVGLYCAVVFGVVLGTRVGRGLLTRSALGGAHARRVAVVGSGGLERDVVEAIQAHPEQGLRYVGSIELRERTRGPSLGALGELGRILDDSVIDVVVFAIGREHLDEIERAVHLCKEQGVEVRFSLDILRFGPGRMEIADMDGIPMLAFVRTPTDVLALAVKRTFDVVTSAAALLVLSPLLAAIAIAIKLESPGPVLFGQRRVGRNGRAFRMLKFRSMFIDAEARLEALRAQNEMSGPVFKMRNDPRVTRVGRCLRRTSLDELPQFWNVLRGEMSVVGPRPPVPSEVRQYKRWQRRRLSVRPGITCIWQISGRNDIDFDRWMELDLEYIDSWSLAGDIAICLKTIPAVLSARGAR